MKGHAVLAVLLVSLVGAAVSSSTSGAGAGVRLYSAKATYSCFKKRPELRPFGWEPGLSKIPPPKSGFALVLSYPRPVRFGRADVPDIHVHGSGPGSWWWIIFFVPHNAGIPLGPTIIVFDQLDQATKAYRDYFHGPGFKGVIPSVIAHAKTVVVQRRNAIIDFQVEPNEAPTLYRSIVLGCLRTS
jgi:hypothetical protein